ncbi:MAG: TonB-dependent receptor [Parvularculaceae bacterium]
MAFAAAPVSGQTVDRPDTDVEGQDRIVISGSLTPQSERRIGAAIEVLDFEDIKARQTVILSDLLRDVAGAEVNRSGPPGALTQIRLRGAESNHTFVLIDGIEAGDPFAGEFNFADLMAFGVDRVEVIRGAQSALYGSDALAGVISVVTKDGRSGPGGEFEAQAGSFGTEQFAASVGAGDERANGRATVVRYDANGVNASRMGREEESYDNLTFHAKGAVAPTDAVRLTAVLRLVGARTESDDQDFDAASPTQGFAIDSDDAAKNTFLYSRVELEGRNIGGSLTSKAALGVTRSKTDNFSGDAAIGGNRGDRYKGELQSTYRFSTGGLEGSLAAAYQHERLEFRNIGITADDPSNQQRSDNQDSLISELNLSMADTLHVSGALRRDFNDRFKNATTYRAAAAYEARRIGGRLHASFGRGVTNPRFFELFGFIPETFQGNPDLRPEHANSFDIGWEQGLPGGASVDVAYFRSALRDEIFTTFRFDPDTGQFLSNPLNRGGKSRRKGVEAMLSAPLGGGIGLEARYTYLDATESDGAREVRRPRHVASVNLNARFAEGRGSASLGLRYNGAQEDLEFVFATPETRTRLGAYTLVNFGASFRLNDRLEVFGRGENLLDKTYEEVFGFQSSGIGAFGGVRLAY